MCQSSRLEWHGKPCLSKQLFANRTLPRKDSLAKKRSPSSSTCSNRLHCEHSFQAERELLSTVRHHFSGQVSGGRKATFEQAPCVQQPKSHHILMLIHCRPAACDFRGPAAPEHKAQRRRRRRREERGALLLSLLFLTNTDDSRAAIGNGTCSKQMGHFEQMCVQRYVSRFLR